MKQDPIVIITSVRTPMGSMSGQLKDVSAPELGGVVIKAATERATLKPGDIDAVIMGNVLSAGLGQAPARQAALAAGLPYATDALTINKMCGSGLKAIMLANDLITTGTNSIVIAGGMENMTRAPYLVQNGREGYRLGHGKLYDHMFLDGLEDAYDKGKLMGAFADNTAEKFAISREEQDNFALRSLERAKKAIDTNQFKDEIAPVTVKHRKGETLVDTDEPPLKAQPQKIPQLRPAFNKEGTVTAANASSIADGAACTLLMRQSEAEKRGLTPLATIIAHSTHSQEPEWFTTAPVGAIKAILQQTGWTISDVDLFEINEAFAVVTLAAMKALDISPEKVNIHGGACALGHPIGASGARIMATLIAALQQTQKQRGIATLCIGGGEAVAVAIELCR